MLLYEHIMKLNGTMEANIEINRGRWKFFFWVEGLLLHVGMLYLVSVDTREELYQTFISQQQTYVPAHFYKVEI